MKYIKLFENFNNPTIELKSVDDITHIEFYINKLLFSMNLSKSELHMPIFIDSNNEIYKYILSNNFIEDMYKELYKNDIMDYSAEEIQWIFKKDGLYTNRDIISRIIERLSGLKPYKDSKYPPWTFYCKNNDKNKIPIFEFFQSQDSKNIFLSINTSAWQDIIDDMEDGITINKLLTVPINEMYGTTASFTLIDI